MSEKIYRFVSFVELYQLLSRNHLKLTKLSCMNDKNEGLAVTLSLQESLSFGWNVRKHEEFVQSHKAIQENSYISCWTKEPESMAMWLLYSPFQDAIRIRTTREKLENASLRWGKQNHWTQHLHSPPGTFQLSMLHGVEDVQYVDFSEKSRLIRANFAQYSSDLGKLHGTPDWESRSSLVESAFYDNKQIKQNPFFLKDVAFEHEKEVRAAFKGGIRNNLSFEKWKENLKNTDAMKLAEAMQYAFGVATLEIASPGILPPMVFIEVEEMFVEEICFDPRLANYKRQTYVEALKLLPNDERLTRSRAFGYLPDDHSFELDI